MQLPKITIVHDEFCDFTGLYSDNNLIYQENVVFNTTIQVLEELGYQIEYISANFKGVESMGFPGELKDLEKLPEGWEEGANGGEYDDEEQ